MCIAYETLTLDGVRKVPLRLVTGTRPASIRHPSDLESTHADAGATRCSVVADTSPAARSSPPTWLFCKSGTDAVFSSCCCWTTARYAFGDDGVDLATAAGGTSPSRAANRSHIARATGTNGQWVTGTVAMIPARVTAVVATTARSTSTVWPSPGPRSHCIVISTHRNAQWVHPPYHPTAATTTTQKQQMCALCLHTTHYFDVYAGESGTRTPHGWLHAHC